MGLLVNPLVILTQKDVTAWKVVIADPAVGDFDGQAIINSSDNKIKIWYNSTWNTVEVTITPGTPPVQENIVFDGENVTFDGEQVKGQI